MSRGRLRRWLWIAMSSSGRCATRTGLVTLVALRVILAPLAEASPPDPSWIAGIYDEGDFDDVVTQVGSLSSICDWEVAPALFQDSFGKVAPPGPLLLGRKGLIARQDRAPPLL